MRSRRCFRSIVAAFAMAAIGPSWSASGWTFCEVQAATSSKKNDGCGGGIKGFKKRLVSTVTHAPGLRVMLGKKDQPAIQKELIRKIEDTFLADGRELTPESQAAVAKVVQTTLASSPKHPKDKTKDSFRAVMKLHERSQSLWVWDVEESLARDGFIIDLDSVRGGLSTVPISMTKRPAGGLRGVYEFLRDITAPKNAAGRELAAVTKPELRGLDALGRKAAPAVAAMTASVAAITQSVEGLVGGPIGFGVVSLAIVPPKLKRAVRVYRHRRNEIYYRDPGNVTAMLEDSIGKATRKLGWSAAEVSAAGATLGDQINQSVREVGGHLNNLHVETTQQGPGKDKLLSVVAVVDSPTQLLENYPLTFELPLTKKSSSSH